MKILVTGSAGFIGFHLTKALLKLDHQVLGIDNLNNYYPTSLKEARQEELNRFCEDNKYKRNYTFKLIDISNKKDIEKLFNENEFDTVIHLAAQAGVRYSIKNPTAYVESNLVGFVNILEGCRQQNIAHLVYASSSSVYGMNTKIPFTTLDRVDHPISLYAATKKSNELMAHTYSHLFNIPTTGLRFFTVYGPWGRPDMAYYSFTKKILNGEAIDVYNNGEMMRDFTYIDDIVEGIVGVTNIPPKVKVMNGSAAKAAYQIYNIGNNKPVSLDRFIKAIENATGKKALKNNKPMQPGDVALTYADTADLMRDVQFQPNTEIEHGIQHFVDWYKYYAERNLV